ncbi:MAG: carboxyl-terminal processing protease [Oleiphilaceae bacterium]|jgi:carboxyl-terminal processing protease
MKLVSTLPLLLSSFLFSALLSPSALSDNSETSPKATTPIVDDSLPLPLDELRKFTDIFGKIKKDYVEEIDDATLLKYAIRGMLSGLDPHSAYLEPSAFSDLRENTSGSFGGLGIEVGMENGFVKVIAPIDDTPAQKGGIEAGDLIIKLDEKLVKGMSLNQAVENMRGEMGTKITLTIVRSGVRDPIRIDLIRDTIKVTSIKTLPLDGRYGYIRITQFQVQTGEDFAKGLEKLNSETDPLSGLIIDLRNNPGGVLQASVQVADQLLNEGLIVYTQGRSSTAELSFSATPGDSTNGIPIIVLIDGGSASASEILAGALQDHNRAVIMGTQSFGKGSVQNVLALDETHGLKLTTARYYTPNGRSIQAQGIVPDIEVNRAKLSDEKQGAFFRESDLTGHLSNDDNKEPEEESVIDSEEDKRRSMLERDFQLQEALNLLKALDIINRSKQPQEAATEKATSSSINLTEPNTQEGISVSDTVSQDTPTK